MFVRAKLLQSCLTLCDPPWAVANQDPLSRQEFWSVLPCPPPGDLQGAGIKFTSLMSPALASKFFITRAVWEAC